MAWQSDPGWAHNPSSRFFGAHISTLPRPSQYTKMPQPIFLLALPLLAAVTGADRLRHDFLHHEEAIFRRQLTCDIGYKPCADGGGCCEIGQTCTSSRGVGLCAGFSCDEGVATCTVSGITACCQRVGEVCDENRPGYCTLGGGGGSAPTVSMSDDDSATLTSDVYTLEPTSTEQEISTSTDVFTSSTVETVSSDVTTEEPTTSPEITVAPETTSESETTTEAEETSDAEETSGSEETASAPLPDPPTDGANSLSGAGLGAMVAAIAGLAIGFWIL